MGLVYRQSILFAVSVTVKREFMEEALDSTGSGKENTEQMKEMIGEFFEQGTEVYKGEGNSECNGIIVYEADL